MNSFVRCLTTILPALAIASVADRAHGSIEAYAQLQLQEQVAGADHVAHAVVVDIQSLHHVANGPVSCGSKYRVRVIEQFKGKLATEVISFATNRFFLPQRQAGDHVLVLLRDVGAASEREAKDLGLRASTDACQRARGSLYLTNTAENIFTIAFDRESKAWLEFSPERTVIPAEVGSVKLPKCEPDSSGGCLSVGPARVEWARVRDALIAAKKRDK